MIESIDQNESINLTENESINLTENESINLTENESINLTENESINLTEDESINLTENESIYIEINNTDICVICLENLDDNVKKACYKCNIKCHKKCLRDWHKSKKKKVCPICLKTMNYYRKQRLRELLDENDELNQEIETDSDVEEIIINNRMRNRYFYTDLYRRMCTTQKVCTYFIFCILGMYIYRFYY